jgi:predicted PurR-regulated permease PerM
MQSFPADMAHLDPIDPSATLMLAGPQQAEVRRSFTSDALRLIGFCLVVVTLLAVGFTAYAAREFLMPIAVAVLLAIIVSPLARGLERVGLPPTPSAGLITLGLITILAGLIALALPELAVLSEQLPRNLSVLEDKIAGLRAALAGFERASEEIQNATQQVGVASGREPVVVQEATPLTIALTSIARLGAQTVAALLLTFFILSQRRRMKVIVIAMARNHSTRKRLITMFNDIKTRISTYLLAISLTSLGLGVACGIALYAIGFPNPFLWGAAVALANFVPYAGPTAVQLLALLVGILTYTTPLAAIAPAFIIWMLNMIESQVVTPMFVARRVVLNPLSVFMAIVFGGWIWGIVGAVVAVPALIIGASIVQHWWAPCSTENRRPILPAWRGWTAHGAAPVFRMRRNALSLRANDIEIV